MSKIDEMRECVKKATKNGCSGLKQRNKASKELNKCVFDFDGVNWNASPDIWEDQILCQNDSHVEFDMDLTSMSVDEFKKYQYRIMDEDMWKKGIEEEHIEDIKNEMKKGTKFPTLFIKFDSDGNLTSFQEGRHRILAAEKLGVDEVPVWLAKRCENRGCGDRKFKPDEP